MLILSRKPNQSFIIRTSDGEIEVRVHKLEHRRVVLGIDAPAACEIIREELIDARA